MNNEEKQNKLDEIARAISSKDIRISELNDLKTKLENVRLEINPSHVVEVLKTPTESDSGYVEGKQYYDIYDMEVRLIEHYAQTTEDGIETALTNLKGKISTLEEELETLQSEYLKVLLKPDLGL